MSTPRPLARRRRRLDPTRAWSLAASALAVGFLVVLAGLFLVQSLPAWRQEGVAFLTSATWSARGGAFGALAMIYGTVAVAAIALLAAAPISLGAALFLSERVPAGRRLWLKAPIELLAGVPSVVYGLLGLLLLRGWVLELLAPFDPLSGDTLLTAGLLLAVMILPTVTTLSDDALRGVPARLRRAARGLGLTRAQTALSVVVPQALPGLAAALLLGLGRALGETIAVFLVVGRQDGQWPERLLSLAPIARSGQTLTSKLGGSETFLAWGDPVHWGAMSGLALVLLALVAALSLAGARLAGRAGPGAERRDA